MAATRTADIAGRDFTLTSPLTAALPSPAVASFSAAADACQASLRTLDFGGASVRTLQVVGVQSPWRYG
jgi:hypothetical protein